VASTDVAEKETSYRMVEGDCETAKFTMGCLGEGSKAGKGGIKGSGKCKCGKMEGRIEGGNHK